MTDDHNLPDAGDLAAELALGVLTGDELQRARALERSDTNFRAEVARWSARLAPMLEEVEPRPAPATAWPAIMAAIGEPSADKIVVLRRRVNQWRAIAAATSALAACLAIVLAVSLPRPAAPPANIERRSAAPMVAMLGAGQQQGTKVVASWDPGARQLVLAVTGPMATDPNHSHELWVIPSGGKPRSLGTMASGRQMHMKLADALADLLQQGAVIAISVEPPGGSPTGAPTGPVVASGALNRA